MRSRIEARIPPLGLAQAERATSVRWRNFGAGFLITLINLVDRVSLSIAMPTIAKEFALSPAMQELILSSFFGSYALLKIPGGRLMDRARPRRVVAVATVLWGVFQTLLGVASGGLSMLFLRVGLGGAKAPLFPAGSKLNAFWLSRHERARGLSLQQIGTSTFFIFLPGALGSLSSGFLCNALCSRSWTRGKVVEGMITRSGLTTLGVLAALPSIWSAVEAVVVLCAAAFFLMWGSLYWSLPSLLAGPRRVGLLGALRGEWRWYFDSAHHRLHPSMDRLVRYRPAVLQRMRAGLYNRLDRHRSVPHTLNPCLKTR